MYICRRTYYVCTYELIGRHMHIHVCPTLTYIHTYVCIHVYVYYVYARFVCIHVCVYSSLTHCAYSVYVSMIKCLTINTCARIIHCFVKCVLLCMKVPFLWAYKGTTHCLPTYVCERYALVQFLLLSALSGDTHPYVYIHVHMSL